MRRDATRSCNDARATDVPIKLKNVNDRFAFSAALTAARLLKCVFNAFMVVNVIRFFVNC